MLYYGAVSLSTALVLIAKDGNSSIDRLREGKKHRHHGLILSGPGRSLQASPPRYLDALESVGCRVYFKDVDDTQLPWGQYSLLHSSLVEPAVSLEVTKTKEGVPAGLKSSECLGSLPLPPVESFKDRTFSLPSLLQGLPELYQSLSDSGTRPSIAPGRVETRVHFKSDGLENTESQDFFINAIVPNEQRRLIHYLKERNSSIEVITQTSNNLFLRGKWDNSNTQVYLPDLVQAHSGDLYFILNPSEYIHEPLAHFMILFMLGMLARYYPDLWIGFIDSDPWNAELLDTILSEVSLKFPLLMLDQILQVKHLQH